MPIGHTTSTNIKFPRGRIPVSAPKVSAYVRKVARRNNINIETVKHALAMRKDFKTIRKTPMEQLGLVNVTAIQEQKRMMALMKKGSRIFKGQRISKKFYWLPEKYIAYGESDQYKHNITIQELAKTYSVSTAVIEGSLKELIANCMDIKIGGHQFVDRNGKINMHIPTTLFIVGLAGQNEELLRIILSRKSTKGVSKTSDHIDTMTDVINHTTVHESQDNLKYFADQIVLFMQKTAESIMRMEFAKQNLNSRTIPNHKTKNKKRAS